MRSSFCLQRYVLITAVTLVFLGLYGLAEAVPRQVTVRVDRWLAVNQTWGQVTYQPQGLSRPAKTGDRLQAVGDRITTGQRSGAVLAVDTGVGSLQVAEKTQVKVRSLGIAPDNGRTTYLDVPFGQVRLQLRRFTHRGSRLEIQTPAGVSTVRGTTFGITVQPNGKTGLATLKGSVETMAQGSTVLVSGGFQNLMIPGDPPSPAVPLRDDTTLDYRVERRIQDGIRKLRIYGQVDPVNRVLIGESSQNTDRDGNFSLSLPAISAQTLLVTVITPLGRQQVHQLSIQP